MLVHRDGSQIGTLGGGCVEAEVKRRALAVLDARRSEVARFQLDSNYGWDDGLICGGRMQILVVPLTGGPEQDYLLTWCDFMQRGAGLTEAVVFDPETSGLPAPCLYLFDQDDQPLCGVCLADPAGAVAPDSFPSLVTGQLRPLAERPRPYAAHGIGYLPVSPRCRLVIVGGGHVGQAVAELAGKLEFDIWVVDDRADYISEPRFPTAERRIAGTIAEVLPGLEITPDTYCLIVTRGHNHDEEALYHLATRGARYVGLIGSRRKIKMIFDDLLAEGVPMQALERVYAPLGIDIGSQTVPEIAVSICAELVAHRNRQGVVPGRPEPVHTFGDDTGP